MSTTSLSEDLADRAIAWMKRHQVFSPDKPFFIYWAPGAAHGPHQIFKEWADKYKGQFDDGCDGMRERIFKRQKDLGLIASHFGGTRNPLVISWPKGIKPDTTPRSQFRHVNDVVPTI